MSEGGADVGTQGLLEGEDTEHVLSCVTFPCFLHVFVSLPPPTWAKEK